MKGAHRVESGRERKLLRKAAAGQPLTDACRGRGGGRRGSRRAAAVAPGLCAGYGRCDGLLESIKDAHTSSLTGWRCGHPVATTVATLGAYRVKCNVVRRRVE